MKSTPHRLKKIVLGSIPFIFILIVWTLIYFFSVNSRWIIPSPLDVVFTFWSLTVNGDFLKLIIFSLLNLIPPFILASICALILGTAMGLNKNIRRIFYPFLSAFYSIPSLAWLPFIVLIFGFTRQAIWVIIFISSFTKIVFNVISGIRSVNVDYILAAKNFGFSKQKIIFSILLPCAFPQILTGLRVGYGSAWRSLIGAEMLVVSLGGLGKFIWTSQWFFDFDKVIAGIILISLISILVEVFIFKKWEKKTIDKWGFSPDDYP